MNPTLKVYNEDEICPDPMKKLQFQTQRIFEPFLTKMPDTEQREWSKLDLEMYVVTLPDVLKKLVREEVQEMKDEIQRLRDELIRLKQRGVS